MSHEDGSESACPVMGTRHVVGYKPKQADASLINGGEGVVPSGSLIGQLPAGHPPIPQPDTPYRTDTPQLDPRLSTIQVSSNIPRGGVGGDEFWQYPSPQRFYNAMQRKGYNPSAEDMQTVVSIHNTVNERAWKEVMEYERYHFSYVFLSFCSSLSPALVIFPSSDISSRSLVLAESVRYPSCFASEADRRTFLRAPDYFHLWAMTSPLTDMIGSSIGAAQNSVTSWTFMEE